MLNASEIRAVVQRLAEEQRVGVYARTSVGSSVDDGPVIRDWAVERTAIDHVVAVIPQVLAAIHPPVGSVIGRYSAIDRPQFVIGVEEQGGRRGVLKVARAPLSREAELLGAAHAAGMAVPEVLARGSVGGVEWILIAYLDGRALAPPDGLLEEPPSNPLALTAWVSRQAAIIHSIDPPVAAPDVADETRTDLDRGLRLSAIERLVDDPQPIRQRFDEICGSVGHVLLHGDLALANTLERPGGGLFLLDPAGSSGPAEFDPSRWIARLYLRTPILLNAVSRLLDVAQHADPALNGTRLRELLGLQLLMDQPWLTAQKFGRQRAEAVVALGYELSGIGRPPVERSVI